MPPTEPSNGTPTGKRSRTRVLGAANATAAVVLLGGGLIAVAAHGHSGHASTVTANPAGAAASTTPTISASPGAGDGVSSSPGSGSASTSSATSSPATSTSTSTSASSTPGASTANPSSTPAGGSSTPASDPTTLPSGSLPLNTLILAVPAGYKRTASQPMDISQVATLFNDQASEVSTLTTDGYRDGWAAGWNNAGPKNIVSDMIWQFSSPTDADTFFTDYYNGNDDVAGHLDTAPAPGIDSSITFSYKPDAYGYVDHVGVFRLGSVVVRVNTDEYQAPSNALLLSLMNKQLARLDASPAVTG